MLTGNQDHFTNKWHNNNNDCRKLRLDENFKLNKKCNNLNALFDE